MRSHGRATRLTTADQCRMTDNINLDRLRDRSSIIDDVFMKYYHVEILVAYTWGVSSWLELNVKYERLTFYGSVKCDKLPETSEHVLSGCLIVYTYVAHDRLDMLSFIQRLLHIFSAS